MEHTGIECGTSHSKRKKLNKKQSFPMISNINLFISYLKNEIEEFTMKLKNFSAYEDLVELSVTHKFLYLICV